MLALQIGQGGPHFPLTILPFLNSDAFVRCVVSTGTAPGKTIRLAGKDSV